MPEMNFEPVRNMVTGIMHRIAPKIPAFGRVEIFQQDADKEEETPGLDAEETVGEEQE